MTISTPHSRNFPTLRLAVAPFRWFFRSRRRVLAAASVLLAMIIAPPLWWCIQLMGLPDIGEPFDAEAFRDFRIPEERNAFVLYRRAADRLVPLKYLSEPNGPPIDPRVRWSQADPRVRRWVEANREAMELFRGGSERPDSLDPNGPRHHRAFEMWSSLGTFQELALLEASRLEDEGDLAGAWTWYRAAIRAAWHLGLHGPTFARTYAYRQHVEIYGRMGAWASRPGATPAMVRRALDDAIACEALRPSEPDTLKAEYLFVEDFLTGPNNYGRQRLIEVLKNVRVGSTDYQLDPDLARVLADAWRFWRREPERSRRVIQLAVANWLAYHELPPDRRPAPDLSVSGPLDFHALGPEAPAGARALSPTALDRWLTSTSDARDLLQGWDLRTIRLRERANHRALVVLLAGELYRRDRGVYPPSDEALVGPYLKELPDDGLGDAGDAKAAGDRPAKE